MAATWTSPRRSNCNPSIWSHSMPLLYRKKVRDAVFALLAANFNSTLGSLASAYGIVPFTLDFTNASDNFLVAALDPRNIELCGLQWSEEMNAGGCLYTSDVLNDGDPKQFNIAAKLFAHVDLYVRQRTGIEGSDTEDQFDAIEEAVVAIMQNLSNAWPGGVIYTRNFAAAREYLIPLSDGFATRIPMKFLFEVYVN